MKKKFLHILALLVMTVTLFSSCQKEEGKVIPRSKMAKIYAEMLLVDQWLMMEPDARRRADTTLVYEPIFEKYGYDSEIYRRSIYKYLDDPERFARIFRTTIEIYDKRLKELNKLKDIYDENLLLEKAREKYKVKIDIDDHFPYMFAEPFVHYYDSLGVQIDSATWEYRFTFVERSDTVYEGLKMIIRVDSTAVIDSLPKADSLVVSDSPAAVDEVKDVPVKNVEVKLLKEKAPVNNARKKENAVLKNELKLLKDE